MGDYSKNSGITDAEYQTVYNVFLLKDDWAKEFTDACRAKNIAPFFYYEMLDRYPETYYNDFTAHLEYMRSEVRVRNMYTFQSERASEKLETYEWDNVWWEQTYCNRGFKRKNSV